MFNLNANAFSNIVYSLTLSHLTLFDGKRFKKFSV